MYIESDIINDCIKIFNENKDDYLDNLEIVDIIDDYYDNYDDIKNATLNEFVSYVKSKIKVDKPYTYFNLREWFNSAEFKHHLKHLRDPSNLEYYLYITNKNNKNKLRELEKK